MEQNVSVVVATHNRRDAVVRQAKWALAHPLVSEVVVVVDGSVDGTVEELGALADERIFIISHISARGAPTAKNAGLNKAKGSWILLIDDDDILSPMFLEAALSAAAGHNADVISAPWINAEGWSSPEAAFRAADRTVDGPLRGRPGSVPTEPFKRTFWGHSNLLISRRVVSGGIRFDPGYRGNFWREETDFQIRCERAGFVVGCIDGAYSYMPGRTGGGIKRSPIVYEFWVFYNEIRFAIQHGRWLTQEGHQRWLGEVLAETFNERVVSRAWKMLSRRPATRRQSE